MQNGREGAATFSGEEVINEGMAAKERRQWERTVVLRAHFHIRRPWHNLEKGGMNHDSNSRKGVVHGQAGYRPGGCALNIGEAIVACQS